MHSIYIFSTKKYVKRSLLKTETYRQQLHEYMYRICIYIAYIFMFIINKCLDFLSLIDNEK